jgi:hypothetical protein
VHIATPLLVGVPLSLKSLALLCWRGKDGTMHHFSLKEKIHSHWEEIGIQLSLSLNQMNAWKEECLGNVGRCWTRVMDHWLTGGGTPDYPATWDGIYKLLEYINCPAIAQELMKSLESCNS